MTAPFRELDTVVLGRDLPEAGLRIGDLGAVVQVHGDETVEVEFVTASGRTQARLTLPVGDVRDDDPHGRTNCSTNQMSSLANE